MRRFFICFFAVWIMCGAAFAEGGRTCDYVRLHVVAESDSQRDQSVKLTVRDAALECARELLADAQNPEEAYQIIMNNLPALHEAAREGARNAGFYGDVAVEAGEFFFPVRRYGDLVVPAGEYRALRITLGEGEGRNWWCVIYPTLCAIDTAGEYAVERAEIVFYSSLGRWLKGLVSR